MPTLTERVSSNLGSLSSADDLARDLGQHVASQPVSSASSVSVELSEVFSVLLYAACATESPSVEDAAAFIDKVFGALPDSSKSTASDEEEQDQEKQTQEAPQVIEQAPKNHRQLLQFAILDVLWAIDSSFEGDAQPWPAPRDAPKPLQELSPQRYKLRNLLALIRNQIPLSLQKLRIALQVATDPNTEGRIAQGEIRARTAMFYKQQKFNLMREESEGYAKLIAELMANMGPPHDPATGLPSETNSARQRRAAQTMERMQALIGHFDLDPTRTLDILLDVFSDNIVHHHVFFRDLLRHSPWGRSASEHGGDKMSKQEPDGGLGDSSGDFICAQVLGFKFAVYQSPEVRVDVPEKLYLLAALLIWDGFVKLAELYPHLSPLDSEVSALQSKFASELQAKAKEGTVNALTMAASLDNSDLPRSGSGASAAGDKAAKETTAQKQMPNQKVGLLKALLGIGELESALFIFSKFAFLSGPFPDIADLTLRLIRASIEPAFRPHSRTFKSRTGAEAEVTSQDGSDVPEFGGLRKRYSNAEHKLVDAPALQQILTGQACPRVAPGIEHNYFFAEWRDRLSISHNSSPEESLDFTIRLLKYAGPYLCRDVSLLHQLLTIGAEAMSADVTETTSKRWSELLRVHILPAVTLSDPNPGLSVALWSLLGHFPVQTRYSFYGEWKERTPKLYPEVKLRRSEAEKDTKNLLRRIGSDAAHNKRFPRQFAKIAHRDPLTIFAVSLSQVQSYENLIMPVVEAARYLTSFEYDVLSYSMLEALADPARQRVKADGLNNSLWLQGLSTFVASLHKKWPFDVSIILQYILKQLASSNTTDLLLFRDTIKHMANIEVVSPADLSENGIAALSGGKTLRSEFSTPTTVQKLRASRKAAQKPLLRLHSALVGFQYAGALLIRVAKAREDCVYLAEEEDAQQLRFLGNMYDQVTSTLTQLHDYFTLMVSPQDYASVVPSLESLWRDYKIDPAIAFAFYRPRVNAALREQEESVSESPWAPALQSANELAQELLPLNLTLVLHPAFFVSFWTLDLYDIHCPKNLYDNLRARTDTLSRELPSDLTVSERERYTLQLRELSLTLEKEKQSQLAASSVTRTRLAKESMHWIPASSAKHRMHILAAFLNHMAIPRARLSPADALFTAKFVLLMHELSTPNFATLAFYDRLFGDGLVPLCFSMTEDEVRNYARFLAEVLSTLQRWYKSETSYDAEAIGSNVESKEGGDQQIRPGFLQKLQRLGTKSGPPKDDFLSYVTFRSVYTKWQKNTCAALRNCIESREYMSIRNGLLLLIPLADYFPFEAKTGQTLLAVVKTLSLRENSDGGREDLKILTRGYEAILSKKSRAWETTAPTPRLPMPLATAPESPAVITPAQPSSTSVSPEGQPQTDKTAKPFIVKEGERPRDALPEQLEKATSEPPSVDAGDQVENDPSVDPSTHADDMPLRTGSAQASLSRAGQKADTSISGKCDDSLVQPSMPVDPQSDISGAASHVRHRLPQRPPVSLASSDTRPGTPDTERPRLSRNSSTATAPAPKSPARHHSGLPPKPSIGTQRRRDGDWGRPDDRTAPNDNERASEQEFFSNRGGLRRRESDRDGGAISNRHPDDGSVDDRSRNIHREALMEPPPMPVKAPAETGITRMSASRNGSPDSATSRSTDRERNPSSRDLDREKERERRARKANERDGDPRESRASRSSRDSRYRERDENRDRKEHRDRDRDGREVDSSKRRRVDDTDNKPPLAHSRANADDKTEVPMPPTGPRRERGVDSSREGVPDPSSASSRRSDDTKEVQPAPPRGPRALDSERPQAPISIRGSANKPRGSLVTSALSEAQKSNDRKDRDRERERERGRDKDRDDRSSKRKHESEHRPTENSRSSDLMSRVHPSASGEPEPKRSRHGRGEDRRDGRRGNGRRADDERPSRR